MTGGLDDKSYALPRSDLSIGLQQWRDGFTVGEARSKCHSSDSTISFTTAILGSGGCVDTLAAIRAGWRPIWGTELCPVHQLAPAQCSSFIRTENCQVNSQQRMWVDLTDSPCLGNTFSDTAKYDRVVKPMNISSGQPCTDYCLGGAQEGSDGPTGWMHVQQCIIILQIRPLSFRLEISDYALSVNEGEEIRQIQTTLEQHYFIFLRVLAVWDYGDPSHRKRLFNVGFMKTRGMDQAVKCFNFPEPFFGEHCNHTARDWAVPDDQVPVDCWRKDNTVRIQQQLPANGEIHYLASAGPGIGPPDNPNKITSWDATAPGPTTLNGNNRRPKLSWINTGHNPVGPSRVTTPVEVPRMASLPFDYRLWVQKFDSSVPFLWKCVHNGVPMHTAHMLEVEIKSTLQVWFNCRSDSIRPPVASFKPDHLSLLIRKTMDVQHMDINTDSVNRLRDIGQQWSSVNSAAVQCSFHSLEDDDEEGTVCSTALAVLANWRDSVRSSMVDTGANASLYFTDIERFLQDASPSRMSIQVADADTQMQGSKHGTLHTLVLGSESKRSTKFSHAVDTVPRLHRELFSVDGHYAEGYSILLKRPDFEDGLPQMHKPASQGNSSVTIPFRYNAIEGGFWMDYLPIENTQCNAVQSGHVRSCMLNEFTAFVAESTTEQARDLVDWLDAHQSAHEAERAYAMDGVSEIFFGQHAEERTIRGVKMGLKARKSRMTVVEFHEEYQHMGSCPGCKICILVMGCMRRIYKMIDPHEETRPAYLFHMDTITYSHRSSNGNKYETVIKCGASKVYFSLYLYLRSDMLLEFKDWIFKLRNSPAMHGLPYKACTVLRLDNAGEWELDHREWSAMAKELGIDMSYTSADRKEEAATAERACGIKEIKTKCGLMQNNLEPYWWETKSHEANWLLNRFPVRSQSVSMPVDGDVVRPLEFFTRGRTSRRMIDRQLTYFVSAGTPCLVHDIHMKGSTIAPKARWMVAIRMFNEQLILWCPRTNAETKTKSFTAFKLRSGIHWTSVIGIDLPAAATKSRPLKEDFKDKVTIQLLDPMLVSTDTADPAIMAIKHTSDLIPAPLVVQTPAGKDLRGSVDVIDSQGNKMTTNTESGILVSLILATKASYLYTVTHLNVCRLLLKFNT